MEKAMKKVLALCLVLAFAVGMSAIPAAAEELELLSATQEETSEVQTASAEETARVNFSPVLWVEKTADKAVYEVGESITWTVTVRNVSAFTAHDVVVTDDMTHDVWMIGVLYPGAALSFSAVTENAQAGTLWNTAVASWGDGDEIPDEEETEEIKRAAGQVSVTVQMPVTPTVFDTPVNAGTQVVQGGEIDIFDEEVPLADVPRTGDVSALWLALSGLASGGLVLLGRKRKEDT